MDNKRDLNISFDDNNDETSLNSFINSDESISKEDVSLSSNVISDSIKDEIFGAIDEAFSDEEPEILYDNNSDTSIDDNELNIQSDIKELDTSMNNINIDNNQNINIVDIDTDSTELPNIDNVSVENINTDNSINVEEPVNVDNNQVQDSVNEIGHNQNISIVDINTDNTELPNLDNVAVEKINTDNNINVEEPVNVDNNQVQDSVNEIDHNQNISIVDIDTDNTELPSLDNVAVEKNNTDNNINIEEPVNVDSNQVQDSVNEIDNNQNISIVDVNTDNNELPNLDNVAVEKINTDNNINVEEPVNVDSNQVQGNVNVTDNDQSINTIGIGTDNVEISSLDNADVNNNSNINIEESVTSDSNQVQGNDDTKPFLDDKNVENTVVPDKILLEGNNDFNNNYVGDAEIIKNAIYYDVATNCFIDANGNQFKNENTNNNASVVSNDNNSLNNISSDYDNSYRVKIVKEKPSLFHMIINVLSYALFIVLLVLGIILLFYFVDQKVKEARGDTTPSKYNAYVVLTGSMVPTIDINDVVVTKYIEPKDLKKDDIITFYSEYYNLNVTHRIIDIYYDDTTNEYMFKTRGDANNSDDFSLLNGSDVYGKVFIKIPKLGYIQNFLAKDGGWIIVILIPCLAVLSYDIMKLFKMAGNKSRILK